MWGVGSNNVCELCCNMGRLPSLPSVTFLDDCPSKFPPSPLTLHPSSYATMQVRLAYTGLLPPRDSEEAGSSATSSDALVTPAVAAPPPVAESPLLLLGRRLVLPVQFRVQPTVQVRYNERNDTPRESECQDLGGPLFEGLRLPPTPPPHTLR